MSVCNRPISIRCLDLSQSIRHKVIRIWEMLESALAMGMIKDETFTKFDVYPYDETTLIEINPEDYELEGWVKRCAISHFEPESNVLVVAAGGLKEFVALDQLGYNVSGIEYGPQLHERSKQWLDQNLSEAVLERVERYDLPSSDSLSDGALVARHYYSHIRKRDLRVKFLRSIKNRLKPGASVVLSYYICEEKACDQQPTFTVQQKIANLIRKILLRADSLVNVGDHMDPESALYHHHFTDEEIHSELTEAGFETALQDSTWFGWTIAKTKTTSSVSFPAGEFSPVSETSPVVA